MMKRIFSGLKNYFFLIAGISVILLFNSCARIVPIQGGSEDKSVPQIRIEASTPNQSRNFKDKQVKLTFDEWIILNNPLQNIIVTPTLQFPLKTKLKGKSLIMEFNPNEVLLDSTTYSIFMGDAVQDITNKNIAKNIKFVFSTGPNIDSSFIQGTVVDVFSGKKLDKAVVSLYSSIEDSSFTSKRPNYFTFSDDKGNFRIDNLKPGIYNLFGLIDKNQNYYYDQKVESIAFLPNPIIIKDSINKQYEIKITQEQGKNFIKEKQNISGKFKVHFANGTENCSILCVDCDSKYFLKTRDSLILWYTNSKEIPCYVNYENKMDTLILKPYILSKEIQYKHVLSFSNQLVPTQDFELTWIEPIFSLDTSKIRIYPDQTFQYRLDSLDSRKVILHFNQSNTEKIKIVLDSQSIQGIHNSSNYRDSLTVHFFASSSLSRLKLSLDSLVKGQQYIFQVVNGEKIIDEKVFFANEQHVELFFNTLFPGKYKTRLIEDSNKNNKWDPCELKTKILPERVWNWELKELRADWDLEMSFKI